MRTQPSSRGDAVACPTSTHGNKRLTLDSLCVRLGSAIVSFVSDKITALIERDHLSDLVLATTQPEVRAHTIHRSALSLRSAMPTHAIEEDDMEPSVSPLAVLIVMGMLLAVFVAIVQL
jgi:hypothetical protein